MDEVFKPAICWYIVNRKLYRNGRGKLHGQAFGKPCGILGAPLYHVTREGSNLGCDMPLCNEHADIMRKEGYRVIKITLDMDLTTTSY